MSKLIKASVTLAAAAFSAATALARPPTETFDRPKNGKVVEEHNSGRWRYTVSLTDQKGLPLPAEGWPQTKEGTPGNPAVFDVPATVKRKLNPPPPPGIEILPEIVKDVTQTAEKIAAARSRDGAEVVEEVNVLYIESQFYDAASNEYYLNSSFGTLAERVGLDYTVRIPDLFADTNGDGALGSGDKLYSLVDLTVYLDDVPTFQLGDTFNIVNGRVAELPGMMFSTRPFVFSEQTGWAFGPGGLRDGEISAVGTAETDHAITAVPEPAAAAGTLCALSALACRSRSRRQPLNVARRGDRAGRRHLGTAHGRADACPHREHRDGGPACSYDLRASPERCPECGTAAAKSPLDSAV